jgi:hypothetical protein
MRDLQICVDDYPFSYLIEYFTMKENYWFNVGVLWYTAEEIMLTAILVTEIHLIFIILRLLFRFIHSNISN